MSAAAPVISVVMAVRNGEAYLHEAVDSILRQTYKDFEFIVIDDASEDCTAEILSGYASRRVVVVRNDGNEGLPASLNRGIDIARGRYVARMDADDVSEPERFARQVAFLESNPDIAVLGTNYCAIDSAGVTVSAFYQPVSPHVIAWSMTRGPAVAHPTVMMRRETLMRLGGYNVRYPYAQDYDLWTRFVIAGERIANLPRPLLRYRRTEGQISETKQKEQRRWALQISRDYIEWALGEPVAPEDVASMWRLLYREECEGPTEVGRACSLIWRLYERCRKGKPWADQWEMGVGTREALMAVGCALANRADLSNAAIRSAVSLCSAPILDRRLLRQVARILYFRSRASLGRTPARTVGN